MSSLCNHEHNREFGNRRAWTCSFISVAMKKTKTTITTTTTKTPHNLRDKRFILAQFQVTVHYCRVLEQLATPHPQSRAERNESVCTCLSSAHSLYLYSLGSKPREWCHPRWVSLSTSIRGIKAVPQRHTRKPT